MPVAFSERVTTQKDSARPSDGTQVVSEVFLHVVLALTQVHTKNYLGASKNINIVYQVNVEK